MVKDEVYQSRPAPVTTLPTPFRARMLEFFEAVELTTGWAPWFPCVPPVVIVYLLSVGNVGGLEGAARPSARNDERRDI